MNMPLLPKKEKLTPKGWVDSGIGPRLGNMIYDELLEHFPEVEKADLRLAAIDAVISMRSRLTT